MKHSNIEIHHPEFIIFEKLVSMPNDNNTHVTCLHISRDMFAHGNPKLCFLKVDTIF
jgi:hypothetical protein